MIGATITMNAQVARRSREIGTLCSLGFSKATPRRAGRAREPGRGDAGVGRAPRDQQQGLPTHSPPQNGGWQQVDLPFERVVQQLLGHCGSVPHPPPELPDEPLDDDVLDDDEPLSTREHPSPAAHTTHATPPTRHSMVSALTATQLGRAESSP